MAALHLAAAAEAPKEWDGLEQRASGRVDLLYVRAGASLAGYKRIRLEPLQLAFDRNRDPNRGRSGTKRRRTGDLEKIKKTLAEEFAQVCESELAGRGYFPGKQSGHEVLEVQPFIVGLCIAAPDEPQGVVSFSPGTRLRPVTMMTELRNSETNQILARVVDKHGASTLRLHQVTSSVIIRGAARPIIARWASALRTALEVANEES